MSKAIRNADQTAERVNLSEKIITGEKMEEGNVMVPAGKTALMQTATRALDRRPFLSDGNLTKLLNPGPGI